MKTISILSLTTLVLLSTLGQVHSQALRLATKNTNGTEEYLYFHRKANYYEYASSARPQRIKLINIKQKMIQGGQKVHYVKFPGQNGIYQLITNGATLFCVNPNGSRQEFIPEEKYVSRGKNGLIEYIYTQGPPPSYFYSNNKSPKKISLTMVKGDMMTMVFKVKFPGSSKVYQLKSLSNGNILCTNPDSSQQMFVKEN